MTKQMSAKSQAELLNEIFMSPSSELKTERFSPENQASAADCSGKCTGICHGMV